ncbi:hypothetical protein LIER_10426 [Lithospermum erythrorhizon]|uniref:Uncharacterized protein n=1 Tax=Lithospermum erythrorhizon TaxID=34254 RepID=A0AAV3PJD6_LITER
MQTIYNPQLQQQHYYPQLYGAPATSSGMGNPYYYGGYSMQASPRGSFSSATQTQRFQGPSYLYYPTQMEGSFSYPPSPLPIFEPPRSTINTSSTGNISSYCFHTIYSYMATCLHIPSKVLVDDL